LKTRSRSFAPIAARKLLRPAVLTCSASADGRKGFSQEAHIHKLMPYEKGLLWGLLYAVAPKSRKITGHDKFND